MSLIPQPLVDARIYWASADLTGYSNKVDSAATVVELDKTTFASQSWHERTGGLLDATITPDGFWQAGDLSQPDDVFWAQIGKSTVPVSVAPTSGAVGSTIYLGRVTESDYKPGAKVGDLLAWSVIGKTNDAFVRGEVMHPQGTPETVTGTTAGLQLGAVLATQKLYCNLHVFSASGTTPSLTVSLQSATSNAFTSPTTRLTFNASTTFDAQHLSVLGAITDTWWRVAFTITGTTPSFLFNVSAGIQ